ncbi:baseplate J/gp47 family protein [Martelella sp. HB161492]|uniref:baseplate J/gp47 family protein n=1 Tax=Martelella sp. HB161492 TaxID=2720726 RepID=UPI00158FE3AA|nr:baseplate J/gp47 family protein [Martelella sp. HB161492]
MAWTTRTLAEISARVRGAFRQYLPGTDSALANNFVTITGKVIAGLAHEFELRMAWLARQMFLSTATAVSWIEAHCYEVGIYRNQPTRASGNITGTGTASTTYPAGIRFYSGNVTYVTTAAATAAGDGTLVLAVRAEVKGSTGNRDSGGILALSDGGIYSDLSSTFTVDDDGLGGGADLEDKESLRARGLQRKQNPPGGGTLTDYERIVLAVSGVKAAWAYQMTGGTASVVVLFLFEGRDDYIPLASDVAVVQAAIDDSRLIRADDSVASAPVAYSVDIEIDGLENDTDDVRAAISTAISAMFIAKCKPGTDAEPFSLSRSWISEAISGVTGETRHELVTPAADILLSGGNFPVLGDVTYGA